MWVVKRPKRSDFCGCPPCGLCFDWVEPQRPVPEWVTDDTPIPKGLQAPVDGLIKMTEDLTGKPFAEATKEEKEQVKGIAQDMHAKAIIRKIEGGPEPDTGMTFQEAEENRWFEANIKAKREAREAEKKYQDKLNQPKSLDAMDWGASEEAKKVLEEAGEQQEKGLKKAAKDEAKKEKTRKETLEKAYQRMLSGRPL